MKPQRTMEISGVQEENSTSDIDSLKYYGWDTSSNVEAKSKKCQQYTFFNLVWFPCIFNVKNTNDLDFFCIFFILSLQNRIWM